MTENLSPCGERAYCTSEDPTHKQCPEYYGCFPNPFLVNSWREFWERIEREWAEREKRREFYDPDSYYVYEGDSEQEDDYDLFEDEEYDPSWMYDV